MLDEGRRSRCGLEGDLLSYLYGEATEAQSAKFENHLSSCSTCADELASFQGIRATFGALREEAEASAPGLRTDFSKDVKSVGFIESLVAFFGGARGFAAAGAFGLVLIAAVSVFVLNRNGSEDIAGIAANTPKSEAPANQAGPTTQTPASVSPSPGSGADERRDSSTPTGVSKENQSTRDVKGNKRPQTRNQKTVEKTPTLSTYDEEEDKSLRLADLFEEIGG